MPSSSGLHPALLAQRPSPCQGLISRRSLLAAASSGIASLLDSRAAAAPPEPRNRLLAMIARAVTVVVHKQEGVITPLTGIPMSARIANAFVSYARYLGQMFWPTNLAIPYLHPGHWPLGSVCLGVALVVGSSAVSLWQGRRRPYLLVGWFWF